MEVVHTVAIGATFFQWLRDNSVHDMPPEADDYILVLGTSDDILMSVRSTAGGRWKTPDRALSVTTLLNGEQDVLVTDYTSVRTTYDTAEQPFAGLYTARLRLLNEFLPDQHDPSRPLGLRQAAIERVVSSARARVHAHATHLPPAGRHAQPDAAEQAACVELEEPKLPVVFHS